MHPQPIMHTPILERNGGHCPPGLSLEYAYQPATRKDLQFYYGQHPCPACGQASRAEPIREAPILSVGPLLFQIYPKLCACGYNSEIFMALNNLLRSDNPTMIPSDEAIVQAKKTHQLPSPVINMQLVAAQVAIHHGQSDEAIAINQTLTHQYPDLLLPWYNLGLLYGQQKHYQDSVTAYNRALELNPTHGESLTGKALALLKSGECHQAGIAYEQWRHQHPDGTVILAQMDGLFGQIQIIDTPDKRSLCIDHQVQGTMYKLPSASKFEPLCRSGPGPLSPNRFAAGALLMGQTRQQSHGLVVGLGCGAGIVMDLANFPDMRLTVVEIDPVMIQLCLTFFPLVQHYVDQGRLEIIEADAITFLHQNQRTFDFVHFDAYQGQPDIPGPFRSVDVIQQIRATAPLLFSNIIGKLNDILFHDTLSVFDQAGCPIHTLYPSYPIEGNESIYLNWIGTTQPLDFDNTFIPFSRLSRHMLGTIEENIKILRGNAIAREELRKWGDRISN